MTKILMLAAAITLGSAATAHAADATHNYPLCSKTVTDECVNPSQAPKSMMHMHHGHHMAHSRH